MKNKILSFVGSRLEGRQGNTQRTSNLSPTNHQRYHRTWGAIFTLVMLFTLAIGNVWGADETSTYDVSDLIAAGTITSSSKNDALDQTIDHIIYDWTKGTSSSDVKISSSRIQLFGDGQSVTISTSSSYRIKSICFAVGNKSNSPTAIVESSNAGTWNPAFTSSAFGNGNKTFTVTTPTAGGSYTFTIYKSGGTNQRADFDDIVVTYDAAPVDNPTITYYPNGATSGTVPVDANSPYTSGDDIIVLGNTGDLAKTNKDFAGWNTKEDGTGITYNAGDEISNVTTNISLYAKWVKPAAGSCTISYTLTRGKADVSGDASVTTVSGLSTTFAKSNLNIGSDNSQEGYCGQITGHGTSKHKDASKYVSLVFTIADGYTFSPSAVSLIVKSNYSNMYSQVELSDGTTSVLSEEFGGSTSDVAASFAAGTFDNVKLSGTVTVKVYQWMKVSGSSKRAFIKSPVTITGTVASAAPATYTLAWNLDGGSVDVAGTAAGSYTAGTTITAPTVSKPGHAFNGWDPAVPATMPAANSEYTATWTANTHSLVWNIPGDATITNSEAYTHGTVAYGTAIVAPTLSREGYDFLGWDATPAATMPDNDLEYTATWQLAAAKHNITYAGYGSADISGYPTEYTEGIGIASFAPLADTEDQHFLGWSPAYIATTATTDQTITATWEDKKVVTFNSNGGSAVADVKVVSGETVAAPTAPTRLNWTFQKWQKGGEDYDFATAVTEDITLDAVWSRNEISGTPTDIVLVSTSAAIGSTSPLTGVYYGNAEWTYTGNAKISTGGAMFGTPNAKKWVGFTLPSGYTATVTANSTSSNDRYCVLVTEADRAGDAGSATKYLNIHVNESGKQTQTSSQIGAGSYALGSTSGGIDINSVVVHVSEAPIMVTFKTGEATYAAITATSGEKLGNLFLNGALPTPVIAGYTFNGWKNGENDATVNDEITASMTITADLTPATYNLTLSTGNGALTAGAAKIQMGASAMTDITATTGTGVLVGYFTTADGDVKVAESNGTLVAGDVEGFVANGKWNRASDAELFAQYLASYNVKFYPGYGENAQIGSTQEVLKNGKAVAPADPEREGYEFLGWSTDGTAANIQAVASYAITAATDFTAVWKQKFTVTYYDGATKLGEETVLAGESPVEAGNYDDKALSTFAGWYNNSNLAEEHKIINVAELVINDNTSIYGKWNKDYATSVNLKAEAASTEDPKPTYEEVLAAHNISGALTNTSWDTGTDIYNGLKIKGKDSYITFNLKQGQFIVMTVGYANNDVKIEVNETEQSFTSSTSALSYFRYYAESADALIKVTKTANNGTASSIRDIYISDPIVVTYNANGGDDVAAANYTGTALTLPSATKDTDSFLGWFDAAEGGNKIGEANDEYTPTANIELFAHWEAISTDARLASITLDPSTGVLEPAFDPEVTNYTYTMPYGTVAVPQITGATAGHPNAQGVEIGDAATAWGGSQYVRGIAQSGDKKTYTITMLQGPKDGVSIISIDVPTGNGNVQTIAADNISGFIGGTATQKLQSGSKKLGGNDNYIGFTLANSEELQAGDVIRLNVSATNGASHLTLYQDASTANPVKDITWTATTGVNLIPVPAEAVGLSTLYIYRTSSACNPTLSEFAILRPMDPVLTAITIDGRDGEIDPLDDKHFNVTIPFEADLAALNVEPTIVSNTAEASVIKTVESNDGAWVLAENGDNTYRIKDKDGDYTDYTITLTRDIKKYTVSFNAQGGSTVQSELVVAGEKLAAAPADPTREDYLFLGWAEAAEGEVVDVTDIVINADKTFYAQWKYENPIVILDENGDIDHDNFFTGMGKGTANFGGADHNCISFGSTASTIVGATGSNKFIVYNAKTTQTRIKFVLYNTQSSAKNIVLQKVAEGETAPTNVVIEVPSQQQFTTEYYAYNSDENRSMYVYTENTGIKVLQVKVIESGTPIHQAGQAGYVLNLNKGRVFAPSNEDVEFEGLSMKVSSNYKALNSEVLQTQNNLSFKVDELVTMTLVSTGAKYQVSKDPAGSGTEYEQGTNKHTLTPGTWYIVSSTGSNIKFTNISFSEPVADYSRPNLNPNNIGTLCWTNNAILGGATLYELAGKNENNYLVFDEVEENRLVAGKPYIFVPENGNTEIKVYNTDNATALEQDDLQAVNGMKGTFVELSSADGTTLWGNYVISKNHYIYVDSDNVILGANRAYITSLDDVAPANQEPAPTQNGAPRRRLVMGGNAPAVATDIDNIFDNDTKVQKVLINGQLFIIRGDKTYDATGRLVK